MNMITLQNYRRMPKNKKLSLQIRILMYALVVYLVCLPTYARAYLDPGSGSYLFQVLIAALLGSLFFMRRIITKVKEIFSSMTKKDTKKKISE